MTDVQTTNGKKRPPKKPIAEHELVDAQGNAVEEVESAQGYRYTLLANSDTFDWYWSQANDDEKRMLALFGAKTLATNETSQVRNNLKGAGSPAEQMESLRERFSVLRGGSWDRPSDGTGAVTKIDKTALATAIVDVLIAKGKITETDRTATHAIKLKQLEDDAVYLRKSRQVPEVAIAYAAIVGRQVATVDDL